MFDLRLEMENWDLEVVEKRWRCIHPSHDSEDAQEVRFFFQVSGFLKWFNELKVECKDMQIAVWWFNQV